ncbi:hypothetical protein [Mobilicoccus caccae]|uniref:Uncharacterized protein n=1 Tax=Mobilicoccus caccae TaxID=1859295 RepID=A0ABQ6J0D9_9MICO|nr:hypothetical protein [Mobilicoccus caccae]GMA42427.1 hypothetical protein GCM10025883_44720 [Mobilicoccus caccae]
MYQNNHNAAALAAVREAMQDSTELTRAELIEETVRVVVAWTKNPDGAPGGEGLDGYDGPERRSLGGVTTEAIRHHDEMRIRAIGNR